MADVVIFIIIRISELLLLEEKKADHVLKM